MSEKIVGHDWADIQRAQQGGRLNRTIDTSKSPYSANTAEQLDADVKLLEQYGEAELRKMAYFGVLDRLKRAGYIV